MRDTWVFSLSIVTIALVSYFLHFERSVLGYWNVLYHINTKVIEEKLTVQGGSN